MRSNLGAQGFHAARCLDLFDADQKVQCACALSFDGDLFSVDLCFVDF
jgi:hypothetical protein